MNIRAIRTMNVVVLITTGMVQNQRKSKVIMANLKLMFLRTETVLLSLRLLKNVRKTYLKLIRRLSACMHVE